MGQYDIDKDVYKNWLEGKIVTIESMTTKEEIEKRIMEIYHIEFYAKREWALLHQQYDKITGKKGIAPWLKEERNKLVDPNFKVEVDWEGEPRKKEKKPKVDNLMELLGISKADLTANLKSKTTNGSKEDKKIALGNFMEQIASAGLAKPIESKPKPSDEEVKNKADALKEKMRLAKEAAANKTKA